MDFEKVLALIDAMNREGVEYVLADSTPEFIINPTQRNVTRVNNALRLLGSSTKGEQIDARDFAGEYPCFTWRATGDDLPVHFFARLDDELSVSDVEREEGTIEGVPVIVPSAHSVREIKRYNDEIDLEVLARKMGSSRRALRSRRYRDVAAMRLDACLQSQPAISRRLRAAMRLARAFPRPTMPRGVYKYRTTEDLNEQKERWQQQHVDAARVARLLN